MVSHYFLPSNSECLRRNAKEFAKIFLLVLKINLTVTVTNSNLFYYFNMNFLKDSDLEFSEKKKITFSMVVFIWMIIILNYFTWL